MDKRLVIIVSSAFALAICTYWAFKPPSIAAPSGPSGPVPEQLLRNEKLWASHKISSYRYTFEVGCFCNPSATRPVVIEVRGGVTTSIAPLHAGLTTDVSKFTEHQTVQQIFDLIREALPERDNLYDLDDDGLYTDKDGVRVTYDAKYGYPLNVEINPNIPDADVRYTISNFQIIQ